MKPSVEQYMKKQFEEFTAFRQALTKESDRGCALFAAAYLDKALSDLLYLSLVADKKIEKDLFEGSAPLATFSSRIKLAFYLGKISAQSRFDLDTIRGIRNTFAHHAADVSFDTQSIADKTRNLHFSYHEKTARPRAHFTASACGLLAMLQMTGLKSMAPMAKSDDAPTEAQKEQNRQQTEKLATEIERGLQKQSEGSLQERAEEGTNSNSTRPPSAAGE